MLVRVGILTLLAAVALLTAAVLGPTEPRASDDDARRAAVTWAGSEGAEEVRRDGSGCEVDVRRADGSVVEVALGPDLELRDLDEERGPGGGPAPDEVRGALRERATRAALRAVEGGVVRGVEREADGSLEVDVLRPRGRVVEVELDGDLRVTDVDEEHVLDE